LLKELDTDQIEKTKRELTSGEITIEQFTDQLTQLAQETMNRQMENQFEHMFLKMLQKHNNGANCA